MDMLHPKRYNFKTSYDVKTGIHNIYVKAKDQTPEAFKIVPWL